MSAWEMHPDAIIERFLAREGRHRSPENILEVACWYIKSRACEDDFREYLGMPGREGANPEKETFLELNLADFLKTPYEIRDDPGSELWGEGIVIEAADLEFARVVRDKLSDLRFDDRADNRKMTYVHVDGDFFYSAAAYAYIKDLVAHLAKEHYGRDWDD